AISTDIIAGFCGETEEDHRQTLSLMEEVGYDMAFMFKYSERPRTLAARKYADDVPDAVKGRRLQEIIDLQKRKGAERMAGYVGQVHKVLIEGVSKRSVQHMYGRNSQNSVVIVPRTVGDTELLPGMFVRVAITSATSGSLQGRVLNIVNEPIATA
ncbi:MAG: TRAM domain-containing protein, partial [Flavobacteriales bacterium]